jgi:hypothetical protein
MNTHIQEIVLVSSTILLAGGVFVVGRRWGRWRDRVLMEKVRSRIDRLRREEAAGVPPSPADYRYAITSDSTGLTVRDLRRKGGEVVAVSWPEVIRATVFKRDLFSVDCLCLCFGRVDGTALEIDEEMAGWNSLMEALPQYLPGCKPFSEWFLPVAFPAFAANPTEIFLRSTTQTA